MPIGEVTVGVFIADHNSPIQKLAVQLRYDVLRKPLGLEFSVEQIQSESDCYHVVAFLEPHKTDIVGCCVLVWNKEDKTLKMRQVAVNESHRRQNVGRTMISFSEKFAKDLNCDYIYCHAREIVLPFYLKQEWCPEGETFEEVGIPHRLMRKSLMI